MTTEKAARHYLAAHEHEMEGRGWAVHNPTGLPVDQLPMILGFCDCCEMPDWHSAMLLAEDGTHLGGHVCSDHGYMPHDLGILEGSMPDRHETFAKHYPDGYRMVLIDDPGTNPLIKAAYEKNQAIKIERGMEKTKTTTSGSETLGVSYEY